MENKLETINKDFLKNKVYIVRDQKVMIDRDLAEIYGYTTKAFNQQVKRNISRFDEDIRYQLTKNEANEILRSHFVTSSWGGRASLPYAFTEQWIYAYDRA